ncbi:Bifunctional enzyme IspD/IspF, partial [Geodia barretti]
LRGAKQFQPLGDRCVIDWAVRGAARWCEGVVVVLPEAGPSARTPGRRPRLPGGCVAAVVVAAGGVLRSDSVRCGLSLVPGDAEIVLVHDGARPLAGDAVFMRVIQAVRDGADAAVPVIELTDTIRRRDGGTADRSELVAVQTPQAFRAAALRAAHAGGADATDDATLVEAAGGTVTMVDGDSRNLKITEPHDLALAEEATVADHGMRVGQGFDVHRYSDDPDRSLVLGGVRFEGERGLDGHSDADVVAHACIEALLAAAGLGDIGQLFSDTDPSWAGADSLELLRHAVDAVRGAGWDPVNVSCSVVIDAPRIAPHRDAMQDRLGAAAGAPVNVTARHSEGVGALGRGEGVAAWAVALVARRSEYPDQAAAGERS